MSKRYKHRPVNFQDFLDRKELEGTIPVLVGDKTFHVRPPETLPEDDFKKLIATEDPIEVAKIMLDDYDGFIAAGGTTAGLTMLIEETQAAAAEQGADAGEDGASSSS